MCGWNNEMNRRPFSMRAGACSGVAQQQEPDNTMITLTEYTAAPSARKVAARTPACKIMKGLQKREAVKRERDQSVLELETRIARIIAEGPVGCYIDQLAREHVAELFSMAGQWTSTLIDWTEITIRTIEASPDAARFALVVDILCEEIAQLKQYVRSARASKDDVRAMFARAWA